MEIKTINTNDLTRCYLAVKVIRVYSPSLIWVHLRNGEEDFQKMMEEFNHRMNRRRFLHLNPKGDDIVALETSKGWQRGIIMKLNTDGTAQISLRDWGVHIRHPIVDLYRLEDNFRGHHWQAIPCGLAYTGSAITGPIWPRRAINIARSIAEQQAGNMQIIRPINGISAFVKLDIRNETDNVYHNLRELLIQLGVAVKTATITTNTTPGIAI